MHPYDELLSMIKGGHRNTKQKTTYELMQIEEDIEDAITKAFVSGEITENQYEQLVICEGKYRHEF